RYARKAIAELLPEPLSPLFATLALPYWNDSMRDLIKRFVPAQVMRGQLIMLVTINDYVYYDYGFDLSQSLRMVLSMPRLIRGVIFELLRRADVRWTNEGRPRYVQAVAEWADRDLNAMSAAELVAGAKEIVHAAGDHYLIIESGIL